MTIPSVIKSSEGDAQRTVRKWRCEAEERGRSVLVNVSDATDCKRPPFTAQGERASCDAVCMATTRLGVAHSQHLLRFTSCGPTEPLLQLANKHRLRTRHGVCLLFGARRYIGLRIREGSAVDWT